MFCFLLSLGAACGNVRPPAPDGRHDAQLLADFLERGVLRESLESVYHGLLIRHAYILPLHNGRCKRPVLK